jgi:NAD(P)-dependent dehydrogenase (short-subunit alcohol dehydrogenase family)
MRGNPAAKASLPFDCLLSLRIHCHPPRPEDIAELALFLASDKAEFITGSNIVIDGGFTAFKAKPQGQNFFRTE